jgi:hypothetical protein
MLNVCERALIRERGYCLYHDDGLSSIVDGEPFLTHGILYYFDGRKLMVCGYPLDECGEDAARVRAVVRGCMQSLPVELVWYCGPERVSMAGIFPSRFRIIRTIRPDATDAELVLDCLADPPSQRLRQWLRSARRQRFSIRRNRFPQFAFTALHHALIDDFFGAIEITPYLLDLAFKIPAMARLGDVEWFEAWEEDRLAGLAAVADGFRSMGLATLLAARRESPGVSDALYGAMRDALREHGKRFLNVGPSPSKGHYQFKTKWGGRPASAPSWWQAWGEGELARRDYDSWPARLIQFAAPASGSTKRECNPLVRR